MTQRGRAVGIVLAAAVAGACGGPERAVVSRYFGALASGDNQTLTSFATVRFEEQVEGWEITGASEERTTPVELPGLVTAHEAAKQAYEANKQAANEYYAEHPDEVDSLRELLKEEEPRIPRRLETIAEEWKQFTDKDLELKRALAEAEDAVDQERTVTRLSAGDVAGIESMGGTIVSKTVDLELTIGGQPKSYVMTLRRYDLEGGSGRERWVVAALDPK